MTWTPEQRELVRSWRNADLEQVAAYCGYRPWRELCALKKRIAELEQELRGVRREMIQEMRHADYPSALIEIFNAVCRRNGITEGKT